MSVLQLLRESAVSFGRRRDHFDDPDIGSGLDHSAETPSDPSSTSEAPPAEPSFAGQTPASGYAPEGAEAPQSSDEVSITLPV